LLKKRSKAISMLIVLAFLFTMILPGMAFGADPAKITYSTKSGVEGSTTAQNLGFVKVSDMDAADAVYVEVSLPSDVDWKDNTITTVNAVARYISLNGSVAPDAILPGADLDEYVAVFNSVGEDDYIKLIFDNIIVKKSAADDIYATVTVKGVEDNLKVWEYSKECLIGQQGDAEVTMTAADPRSISVGSAQKLAKVTLTENVAGALKANDTFTFTLPKNFKWDYSNIVVKDGKYGLAASTVGADSDDLTIKIDSPSVTFEDKLEITGYVVVYPNAADGDLEVDVEGDLADADFDDASVILAYVGDSSADLTVEDTSEDTIYQADVNREIDTVTVEATGTFAAGDQFTISLSDGVLWYEDEASFESAVAELDVLGFYDDNQSVWVEVNQSNGDGKTEIDLDGLHVATLPDAPVGEITLTLDGDYSGDAVVGEVIAAAEVTADAPVVTTASLGVAAGDITIVEAKKASVTSGKLYLELPTGVFFSGKPTVEVNGDEVSSSKIALKDNNGDSDDSWCEIDLASELRSNKADTIVISDIEYDLDTRVRGTEIAVKLSGPAVNDIVNATASLVPDDFEDDYADDAVFTVVNATTQAEGTADSIFTIGSTTYSINGVEYTMDVAPYISGDRTYLPVRFVAYAMGVSEANILWDGAAQTVTLLKGDKVVQLKVGSTTLLINGAAVTMDVAPQITADRVCLPIRFVAQAFGAVVGWDAATQQVSIDM